jgi:hypothetical protein
MVFHSAGDATTPTAAIKADSITNGYLTQTHFTIGPPRIGRNNARVPL